MRLPMQPLLFIAGVFLGLAATACGGGQAPTPVPPAPTVGLPPTPAPTAAPVVASPTPLAVKPTTVAVAPTATVAPPTPTLVPAPRVKRGGILRVTESGEDTLDIHRTRTPVPQSTMFASMNSLVMTDPSDHATLIGDLAERWDVSPDGKVITFYLRKDVTWHDGQKFTGADVLFSIGK